MPSTPARIRCTARLQRPAAPADADWRFLLVPAVASARLPSRGLVTVDGTFAGQAFVATLQPDGQGGHWLRVPRALSDAADVAVGDAVALVFAPVAEEPEPVVPDDVRAALSAHADAHAQWTTLTPVQRRDWIHWIVSGKKADTRTKRLATACDMLASGKRRACCFDRSGLFSRSMSAPEAAD
ncbi:MULTISPECIES: YdeI/OmpD-associated family protein [Luteimonas]|uniref:YdeI/OmpD-associated family protein n=1 Tax=Luteimonas TaxID=83614 RepID=UPI000C7DA0DA|nr:MULTISPECIES: YdeI/OmpD-associated family protein [Luteimonas]